MSLCFIFLYILVSFSLFTSDIVLAVCPSNGNTHVIYVTSNMGNNIWAFDTTGKYIGTALNMSSFPFRIEKLRDMKFGPGNYLYVTSARGKYSRIFAVSGNGIINGSLAEGCVRNYLFTVTSQGSLDPFLDHPYSVAFHPTDGTLYVSNQNSVTVTKYALVDDDKSQYPSWKPVKNVKYALSDASAPKNVSKNAGLFASSWSKKYSMTSVRGLTLSPLLPRALVEQAEIDGWYATTKNSLKRYLLVCDVASDRVHVFYADTGEHVFWMSVPSPIQVIFPSQFLGDFETPKSYFKKPYVYVTSKDAGVTFLVPFVLPSATHKTRDTAGDASSQRSWKIYAITTPTPQHAASGIFENPSHETLLIADRIGRKISTFASPFSTTASYSAYHGSSDREQFYSPFLGHYVSKLPDQPEFILTTMVEQQGAVPFCYELSADGSFRYVALCTAAYIWTLVLIVFFLFIMVFLIFRALRRCHEVRVKRGNLSQKTLGDINVEGIPFASGSCEKVYGATT